MNHSIKTVAKEESGWRLYLQRKLIAAFQPHQQPQVTGYLAEFSIAQQDGFLLPGVHGRELHAGGIDGLYRNWLGVPSNTGGRDHGL